MNTNTLKVYDHAFKKYHDCPILHKETIEEYGEFYIVYVNDIAPEVAVIKTDDGTQFTLDDWQGFQPQRAEEICNQEFADRWVDGLGNWTFIINGLPRSFG